MSRLCVGIDAGGTNVRVRWNESELRCAADPEGGPEPVLALLAQVPGKIEVICAGITKVSRGEIKASWETALSAAYPSTTISVVPDYVVAFHGAIPEGIGILCVAGTGSVIYGEDESGKSVRVGGRGWEFGDEGSGAYVTTELMHRTLRACDGLWPHTALTKAVCGLLETDEPALVGERARQRALIEGRGFLVRVVHTKAAEGDQEAQGLFTGAAAWLARFVRAA
ncbi:BadF/BadG/BcrA/BcrD ATPase family protein, partial [Armatimonas sp.]|uniref:BadF/BadG/BcrA/BcrD ATPase family protein n=1 Tax=Armatimonas sp. TaxID=1872638 RepID=UPI00286B8277